MRRVRLFHWNATEAQPLVRSLRASGYTVDYPNEKAMEPPFQSLRDPRPDVIAIDIPDDIGQVLAAQAGGVSRAVLEAVAIEAYRSGAITPPSRTCLAWIMNAFDSGCLPAMRRSRAMIGATTIRWRSREQ